MTYMKGDNNMPTVLPKENEVEQFFSRIMASEGACERLSSVLYDHLSDDDMQTDPDPKHLVQVLLTAYTNGDISALLLELCGRSLFDLLREAYLIPKRFHGKAGKNPELLTTPEGDGILSTRYSRLPQLQWSITDRKQAKRLENHLMRSAFYCLFISLKRKCSCTSAR